MPTQLRLIGSCNSTHKVDNYKAFVTPLKQHGKVSNLITFNCNFLMRCALLSIGLLLWSSQATAFAVLTNPCPAWQPSHLPATPQGWQNEYYRLRPLFPQCLGSADYLAYLGAIELRTGRIGNALDTLERALLLNPLHGAAQMDYAQALHYNGDPFAAQSLNRQLLSNPNLPPLIRQQISLNQKRLNQLLNTFTHQLTLNTGYDSNLNTSPTINQLTLTLDGEEWLVALNEGLEPRSGAVARLGLSSRYTQHQANSRRSFELSLNSRLSENRHDQQHQLSARYQQHHRLISDNSLDHELALIALQHGDEHNFTTLEAQQSWQRAQPLAFLSSSAATKANANADATTSSRHCQFIASHTLAYQDFPSRNHLNAVEYRLAPRVECDLNPSQLSLGVTAMYNHALENSRAGGNRQGHELTAQWYRPLGKGRLQAQARYSQWQDNHGYSPTLSNNARRKVVRNQLSLAYSLPLSPHVLLTTQAALQKQTSNLSMFEFNSRQFDFGIRWQF